MWVVGVDGSATADAAVESVYNYKGAADIVHVIHVRDKDDTDPARFTAFVERCEKHADAMGSKFVLLDTSPERGIAGAVLDYVRAAHAGVAMCVCCVVLCVCVCLCVFVCVVCVCVCVCVHVLGVRDGGGGEFVVVVCCGAGRRATAAVTGVV